MRKIESFAICAFSTCIRKSDFKFSSSLPTNPLLRLPNLTMATSNPPNSAAQVESKSSKKKKAKAESPAAASVEQTQGTEAKGLEANGESSSDSPYIRELHKLVFPLKPSALQNS